MSHEIDQRVAAGRRDAIIAAVAIAGIAVHLVIRWGVRDGGAVAGLAARDVPLVLALVLGGTPLVWRLLANVLRREFGSDLLAGISIVTSILLEEYLAGTLVVLMLSGGETLEAYAARSASSVLEALARRLPSVAHVRRDGSVEDVLLADVAIGDTVVVYPHEVCPVDGTVIEGRGVMDESYLTGEPYMMSKTPGAAVLSGAVNGDTAITVEAAKLAEDSRYARIMEVMRASAQERPRMRRLGDTLGAWYTPIAVAIAIGAWAASGDPLRFLAVLVVATPCPLLIAIPVAIVGSISLAARRGIVIRDPAALERIATCRTAFFDKTGTLTYGEPRMVERLVEPEWDDAELLGLVASLERYSKHPLSSAVSAAADRASIAVAEAESISEAPGEGLRGRVGGREVVVTSRRGAIAIDPGAEKRMPERTAGLECTVVVDGRYAATYQFRDEPRGEGRSFIQHLRRHGIERVALVSGDRASEVEYLARQVGIDEVRAEQTPEQKLALVREETARRPTLFVGDGINDAPALAAATVGVAFGTGDVAAGAAGAVIFESSLRKLDELLHIATRMRTIALQSAVGGMGLSAIGMGFAAAGLLPPVAGAIAQEVIDVAAVVNALRAAIPPRTLSDMDER